MRVLFVSHSKKDPNGGASRVYHLLEEGLTARGHHVKALHYEDLGIPSAIERIIAKLFLPHAASRRAAQEDLSLYDVIMSSNGMTYPLFKKLQQRSTHPVLINHLHGLSYFDHQARITEMMRGHLSLSWAYRLMTGPRPIKFDALGSEQADLTIVQNGRDWDYLKEKGVAPVVSIPLSIHPEILEAGTRAPSLSERDPHSFLWFGSWVERKGQFYLPGAFQQIVAGDPAATLTIGGTGMRGEDLKAMFAPDLRDRITVLQRISVEEQIAVYGRHAIFLFPSISEGFGFALLEAMSMGLAAVTTETGLAGDWLHDFDTALIIPSASAYHLGKAGLTLALDTDLRQRIALNGQALSRRFTQERFISQYETELQNLVSLKHL